MSGDTVTTTRVCLVCFEDFEADSRHINTETCGRSACRAALNQRKHRKAQAQHAARFDRVCAGTEARKHK